MKKKHLLLLIPVSALFSCTAHHMATADKAYERMAFSKAACNYEKVLHKNADREAAIRAAESYQRQNDHAKAADWYSFADRISPLNDAQALRYAQILITLDRLDDAKVQLERKIAADPDHALANELLKAASERSAFYMDSALYTVRPVQLEGIAGAFSASHFKNGLIFAGEKQVTASRSNPWNGLSFLDLYVIERTPTGAMGTPKALPGEVNGRYHDGPAVLSPDGRTLYFTRSDYQRFRLNKDYESVSHLKLFQATLANGEWTSIEPFAHNGEEYSTGHAAISSDGNTIYFISDRAGGFGGTDIYSSTRTEEGWSKPINLGSTINSAGNEMFPTFHGDTLYFSSNGHAGVGGLDIFKTWRNDEGWTAPANVNAPLNSPFDDLSLIFNEDGISGYLSSDRTGSDAIHSFVMNDPIFALKGICINSIDGSPMAGVPVKVTNKTTGEVIELTTDDHGYFNMDLDPGQEFLVHVTMDNMFTESADVSTLGERVSKVFELKMNMRPIEMDKPILVNNIYYDYDKWDIRPDAAVELLKLARVFKDNPGLSFELSSHTDSRASHLYNLVLSEARAKSAVDFLIRNGVDPDRIVARGYGELQPINNCRDGVECDEDQHQENRRTEFKVIRTETAQTR